MRQYYVYILASTSRRLYVGVTNNLRLRVWRHRQGEHGFTARYRIHDLVYFETTQNVYAAITREKQIKGWKREKKIALIESKNRGWLNLARDWFQDGRE
jgi:putative endonuclease